MEMSEIIRRAGGLVRLAAAVDRHHATIWGWSRVPPKHVRAVAAATGLTNHDIRPDLWDPPEPRPLVNETPQSKPKRTARASSSDTPQSSAEKAA
jgi:DNA-binding transcriptional regulator YdaS (Cro superfamily)